jgi:hypothetical protein
MVSLHYNRSGRRRSVPKEFGIPFVILLEEGIQNLLVAEEDSRGEADWSARSIVAP